MNCFLVAILLAILLKFAYGSDSEEAVSILLESNTDPSELADQPVANLSISQEDDLTNLRFVNVIWRGGIHNCDDKDALFKNLQLNFPEAKGHLTKLGKQQIYKVGRFLRNRYGAIFNSTYDPFAVRFLAGDKNRSIDSGLMVASGLFPPREQYEVWNPKLIWQPIAVHVDLRMSITGGVTTFLEGECPNFQYIANTVQYKSLSSKWQSLVEFLCISAGSEATNLLSAYKVAKILDILTVYADSVNDTSLVSMPEWANETVVKESKEFFWDVQDFLVSYQDMNTVASGYILDAMIGEMKDHVKRNTTRRLHGFSSHVDILHSFVKIISPNYIPFRWPMYGSFMVLELHKTPKNQTIVKALLWPSVEDKLVRIAIDGCLEPCTLEKFEKRSTKYMSNDYKGICGILDPESAENAMSSSSGLLFGLCLCSMVVSLISLICCLRTKYQINKIKANFERKPLINKEL